MPGLSLTKNKKTYSEDLPVRADIYGRDVLREHARKLAHADTVKVKSKLDFSLSKYLDQNGRVLEKIYEEFNAALLLDKTVLPPSAEWLLENYYLVVEQIRQLRQDLESGYYKKLPILTSGRHKNFPRVYGIAYELVAHTDSRIDHDVLVGFVNDYQRVTPLTSGELWAMPMMLRFVLLENLTRLMARASGIMEKRRLAGRAGVKVLKASSRKEKHLYKELKKYFPKDDTLDSVFIIQLLQNLREADPAATTAISWIENLILEQDLKIEEFIRAETHQRAANRASVGNVISSLRILAFFDWSAFFEETSPVEKILQQDPEDVYSKMDFATRDRYRHVIEGLSRFSSQNEQEIARRAVRLASTWKEEHPLPDDVRESHVGYYLVSSGLKKLKRSIDYKPSLKAQISDWILEHPANIYISTVVALTLLPLGFLLSLSGFAWGLGVVLLLVLSAPSIQLVNMVIAKILPPSPPPKIELSGGVPDYAKTFVVVPCLLTDSYGIRSLLDQLEHHYLSNKSPNIKFGLLSDFSDAPNEKMPEDSKLLEEIKSGVQKLNSIYADTDDIFYLFHRHRLYNPQEKVWMGWERKRGKLVELNRLLRGSKETSYSTIIGDSKVFQEIKYVITLDADTDLPLNAAVRMVGAMLHPLNRPIIDEKLGIVVDGYGIIQPRVDVKAPAAARSLFAKIFTRDSGLDPYQAAVSNVYQDLFGSGIFIGKGIYDVDAFAATIQERFPENTLLSHDLIEGVHARTGLASDIELLEDFPSGYASSARRVHRWIRGDWQIAEWILADYLPASARWKIFDNLRRSLVVPFTLLLLFLGWTVLPGGPFLWTTVALFSFLFPIMGSFVNAVFTHPLGEPWKNYFTVIVDEFTSTISQAFFLMTFLLSEGYRNTDAILRALTRKYVTHSGLLEWVSQADVERHQDKTVGGYMERMWVSMALSPLILFFIYLVSPGNVYIAVPFAVLWFMSPVVAYSVSKPIVRVIPEISEEERRDIYAVSARIWRFFDELAGSSNNHLPPDNVQFVPTETVAQRTSPTNIGLYLLSIVSAYDLGYLTKQELVNKVGSTFDTLDRLQKYRGHFLNWYSTETLEPINSYVSTVDSGNLAASLITLSQSLFEISLGEPREETKTLGIYAVLENLRESLTAKKPDVSLIPGFSSKTIPPEDTKEDEQLLNDLADFVLKASSSLESNSDIQAVKSLYSRLTTKEKELRSRVAFSRFKNIEYWVNRLGVLLDNYLGKPVSFSEEISVLASKAKDYIKETDFSFLLDKSRGIFSIGFNISSHKLDNSYYDLLASEARISSYFAVSHGQLPAKHWFKLSRPLTRVRDRMTLLSWGGSMFEYLMPNLFMKSYDNTLLDQTVRSVLEKQIEYGKQKNVPWGISESGFFTFDYQYNFQYRLFGVPELGLKPELSENLVISPYSTFLAFFLDPKACYDNITALKKYNSYGRYGFFEALDFTTSRLTKGHEVGIVQSYMAHHQGMSLVALNNYLNKGVFHERFHNDPSVASSELLLQERIPRHAAAAVISGEKLQKKPEGRVPVEEAHSSLWSFNSPNTSLPRTHVLSNGEYSVVTSNAGGGFSTYNDISVTRYQLDSTLDRSGQFFYLRDTDSGFIWSSTYQPTLVEPDYYKVTFYPDKTHFERRDRGITTEEDIVVSPERNVEIRTIMLTNNTQLPRNVEVTSYAEVALEPHLASINHPAFGKLFVESDFEERSQILTLKRRPRSQEQEPLYCFHMLSVDDPNISVLGYETDRMKFLGRNHSIRDPENLDKKPSNSKGIVLDPVMSLRTMVHLYPGETKTFSFVTGTAESREEALTIGSEYDTFREVDRVGDLAKIHSQIERQHLGMSVDAEILYQKLGSRILYPDPVLKSSQDIIEQNQKGQGGLYAYGISGDYPIILLRVKSAQGLPLVRQLLTAHEYFRAKNFHFDFVILEEHPFSYSDELFSQIQYLIDTSLSRPWVDKPGGVFLRRGESMPEEDRVLFQTVARLVIDSDFGSLDDYMNLTTKTEMRADSAIRDKRAEVESAQVDPDAALTRKVIKSGGGDSLLYSNGFGGFREDGWEYIINLEDSKHTPLPWANVISNPAFGTIVDESTLGYTWAVNSQLNKLTPWTNDPVSNSGGEILYLKDEKSGEIWSATPYPIKEAEPYTIRHAPGYTVYEHSSHGLTVRTAVFVAKEDPVKFVRLRIKNDSNIVRSISGTYMAEWVLGTNREQTSPYICTEFNRDLGLLTAKNVYSDAFKDNVAFLSCSGRISWATSDRKEFIGRNGTRISPEALHSKPAIGKSGHFGANLDPCAVVQTKLDIAPGEDREVVFMLGAAKNDEAVENLVRKYMGIQNVSAEFSNAVMFWENLIGALQVNTPDKSFDFMVNVWLPYQVLSCRYWARAGFYQAGGAYGFRDQLQDSMAFVYAAPHLLKEHILRAAAHQYSEGDVMHWWHYPLDTGVRTKISDDLLWLPYAVSYYIKCTGDKGILDEVIPFVQLSELSPEQSEIYGQAVQSGEQATLYIHCLRAIEKAGKFGEHGLPLMGSGDWNDGMNSVGDQGKGESVWLGWFLYKVLTDFSEVSEMLGDTETVLKYKDLTEQLKANLNEHGWDGSWYRRAYFDTGEVLGSVENGECKVDAIAQSWSVISGAGDPEKTTKALETSGRLLINDDEKMILLLTPPFSNMEPSPGYIQGYVPGIRENGGQYTHGAVWTALAYLLQGDFDRGYQLWSYLNPVNRSLDASWAEKYKLEPYTMAADIYSNSQHLGRGGWSWYTGSAGWMYRIAVEYILGIKLNGDHFTVKPAIPSNWDNFELTYTIGETVYRVQVISPIGGKGDIAVLKVNGEVVKDNKIPLVSGTKAVDIEIVLR